MLAGSQPELYDLPNSNDPSVARYNEIREVILEYLDRSMQVFIVTVVIASTTSVGTVQVGVGIDKPQGGRKKRP